MLRCSDLFGAFRSLNRHIAYGQNVLVYGARNPSLLLGCSSDLKVLTTEIIAIFDNVFEGGACLFCFGQHLFGAGVVELHGFNRLLRPQLNAPDNFFDLSG
ncbi:hypothetical protein [Pseudomonas sp. LFS044]|uniref:hypothetical protein n=1 Tax=Pseudomonas sp. LFS044 TaxID=3229880 RepID=UPI003A7FD554